jgi:lysophospholipase L1-like esterase
MKKYYIILLPIFLLSFTISLKKKVVFFGDSITQMGVNKGGYIMQLDSIVKIQNKNNEYELVGAGIGGNKIYDLYLRLEKDVIAVKPDIVVVYVGVNDIWHKSMFGTGTDADKFVVFYQAIIDKLKSNNIKVVLCTPSVIGERADNSNPQDGELNMFSNIIRNLTVKNQIPLIDLRQYFQEQLTKINKSKADSGFLTTDRVHLNNKGNLLVAEKIWDVLKEM